MTDKPDELQPKGAFVLFLWLLDRMQPIPKPQASPDDDADENADQKKDAIGRKGDQEHNHDGNRDKQSGRTVQAETKAGTGARRHDKSILLRLMFGTNRCAGVFSWGGHAGVMFENLDRDRAPRREPRVSIRPSAGLGRFRPQKRRIL